MFSLPCVFEDPGSAEGHGREEIQGRCAAPREVTIRGPCVPRAAARTCSRAVLLPSHGTTSEAGTGRRAPLCSSRALMGSWGTGCFPAGGVVENSARCRWEVARTRCHWKYQGCLLAPSAPSRCVRPVCVWHRPFSQGSPSRSTHPLTLGPMAPFPSRSFESNLNTYKRLAIKLPDDQIVKVGDMARCPESHPTFPADPRLLGYAPAMCLWHVWRGHSVTPFLAEQL